MKQAQHLVAKKVRPYHAHGSYSANTQVDQVRGNVAGAAQTVALREYAPHRQSCFNGELSLPWLQLPIGVQAEVAKYRHVHSRELSNG
jgi:hypothetical protein